ncbi:acetate--CoA ligase family protein [Ramlibacter sp.]|uniref:acetate--CoA ligase family protein n=1 Tax=Ramlibacter sp. TaxID=1917967 RepID=UPI003D0BCEE4
MNDDEGCSPDASEWLERLYAPRSVAVVGASDDIKLPGGRLLQFMLNYGFAGHIYPINPNREQVQGRAAFKSLADLPEPPDIAIVLVSAAASVGVLEQCAALKIPAAMFGNSGFAEIGPEGAALQERVARIAREGGIRLVGPNTNGIVDVKSGFTATFSPVLDQKGLALRDGPVAIVSQSGAVGAAMFYDGQRSGLGVGRLYNSGNEIGVTLEMVVDALLDSPRFTTVLCYVEGLRRPELFAAAARKAQRLGKRIVLLKAGATAAGAKAAAAHTASLAGEDRVYDGVLHQLGVARARGYTHLLDIGRVLATYPKPYGRRASILSMSGGIGIMLTDALERAGMGLAQFDATVLAGIEPLLPAFLGAQNPLDVSGGPFHHLDRLRTMLRLFDGNPGSDITIVAVGSFERRQMEIAEVLADEAPRLAKPLFVLWFGGGDEATLYLNGRNVPTFPDAERLVQAIAPGVRPSAHRPSPVDDLVPDRAAARAVLADAKSAGRKVIDEVGGKRMLSAYGIDVVNESVVDSPEAVRTALANLRLPVVAKLRSDALVHKARVGGVRLGLATSESVAQAVADLFELARRLELPDADVVLQEQVPAGVELLLGAKRDATFGMVVTLGIGGVQAEAWDDVQIRLVDDDATGLDVHDMLARLAHRSLLDGSGGRTEVDATVLAPTVLRFARLVRELADDIDAIDVNPIIVREGDQAPTAVDTVFFLKD